MVINVENGSGMQSSNFDQVWFIHFALIVLKKGMNPYFSSNGLNSRVGFALLLWIAINLEGKLNTNPHK